MSAAPVLIAPELQPVVRRRPRRLPLDPCIAIGVLGLCAASLEALAAGTAEDVRGHYVSRQAAYFAAGCVLAVLAGRLDWTRARRLRLLLYGLLLAGIVLVMAAGTVARGSRRAIELGFFSFQASELGKLLLVVVLAAFAAGNPPRAGAARATAGIVLLMLAPAALVAAQPDLGSALVYVVIALATLFFAGAPWRHFAVLGVLGAVAAVLALTVPPAFGLTVLHDYQVERLTSFVERSGEDGYQQSQSLIAIGSGRLTGRGDDASQTALGFVPEAHTDFVFAVVAERWGFAGAIYVLAMYGLLVGRGLAIALRADLYGRLVAGGIVAMLVFQVFVNVGMNVGLTPITGIPLPLLTYGGSSVLTTFLAFGLLESIRARSRT